MGGAEDLRDLLLRWEHVRSPLSRQAIRREIGLLRLRREDVAEWSGFSEDAYQRIRLRCTPWIEVLLLCWRSGQRSPIHDHSGSTCGVRVVAGTATETLFATSPCGRLVPTRSRRLEAGAVCVSRDADIHQLGNLAPAGHDLVTLHVYSPPLAAMRTYAIGETTLADHDRLAASRPKVLARQVQVRVDGAHDRSSSTPRRASKVTS